MAEGAGLSLVQQQPRRSLVVVCAHSPIAVLPACLRCLFSLPSLNLLPRAYSFVLLLPKL